LKKTSPSSSSKASSFAGEQYLYLTTRGRKTGRPREIEIWFTERAGRFYVIAEYATSHWVENLRVHPEAEVRVAGGRFHARARVLSEDDDGELRQVVQELSRQKYDWGDGTVVELAPEASDTKSGES
jgi:deazaflavin-dependent oxidoreductase (nitroreductase family)